MALLITSWVTTSRVSDPYHLAGMVSVAAPTAEAPEPATMAAAITNDFLISETSGCYVFAPNDTADEDRALRLVPDIQGPDRVPDWDYSRGNTKIWPELPALTFRFPEPSPDFRVAASEPRADVRSGATSPRAARRAKRAPDLGEPSRAQDPDAVATGGSVE